MENSINRIVTNTDVESVENVDSIARAYTGEDGKRYIRGYAAVYGVQSRMLYDRQIGPFVETIEKGAFSDVINDDTYLCRDHLVSQIFGRTTSETLRLWEDDIGLAFEVEMPENVSYANDTYELVKRGDLFGCSFRAQIDPEGDSRSKREDGATLRTISSFKRLVDVSVVGVPAYPDTSVSARNIEDRAYSEQLSLLEEMQTKIFIIQSILEKDELSDDDRNELEVVLNDMIEYSQRILTNLNLSITRNEDDANSENSEETEEIENLRTLKEKEIELLKLKK